eukprot:366536-Chlamydomonas_euryale.AAC.16
MGEEKQCEPVRFERTLRSVESRPQHKLLGRNSSQPNRTQKHGQSTNRTMDECQSKIKRSACTPAPAALLPTLVIEYILWTVCCSNLHGPPILPSPQITITI